MAFQPIVDIRNRTIFAYEALCRGKDGSGAGTILSQVDDQNRYAFDQACRVKAIELAASLGMETVLSINFLPNAVYEPKNCLRVTLSAARRFGFPLERIMFEIAEGEKMVHPEHLVNIISAYKSLGLITAIDDFGAGWSGLNLLADVRPQVVKLDMKMCQGVAADASRRTIVAGLVSMASGLGMEVIAEGIETEDDLAVLDDMGIHLFQGYLFARPGLEQLPEVTWPLSSS